MDNVRSHADTRLCGNTCLKRQINMPRKKFSVGAWVKVPTEKTVTGVDFIIGKIIGRTPYFFVVKSEAGGFSVAYTWVDLSLRQSLFKILTREEALALVSERLKQRWY